MRLRKDFCVFILSYGRPDNIKTLKTLKKVNYSGDWFVIDSDDDSHLREYQKRFGSNLCVFNKHEESKYFDMMDNQNKDSASIVYARNYCFKLAKKLGYRYFLEFDDDYDSFSYRYIDGGTLKNRSLKNADAAFEATLKLLDDTNALTIAWSQGGDLIGGLNGTNYKKKLLRKAMNSFFIDTRKPFNFVGRINEDVNMYVDLGSRGQKIFQVTDIMINQATTQLSDNGMTSLYLDYGTFLKSFYSVMIQPSFVQLQKMGVKNLRIHHSVNWRYAVPKILNPKYKK